MNLFDAIFSRDQQAPAIIYQGREISYAELRAATLEMAAVIASVGTKRKDRVAVLLNDSPEFVQTFIASSSMGAIAVPINPALRLEDQCAIIDNCSAGVLIVEAEFVDALLTHAPKNMHFPKEIIEVDQPIEHRSDDECGDHFEITEMIRRQPPVRINTLRYLKEKSRSLEAPIFPTENSDDTAFILYTSGSTGEPKGAMHSQADIFYTNDTFCHEVLHLTKSDRLFSSSRLPFAYGLGNSLTFPLLNGATSVLCREKPTPEIISHIFRAVQPTIFFAVPVVYNLLLEHHRNKQALDCTSLRMCVSAGEALPADLGKQWQQTFGVPVLDGIGSTEMLHMFMSNHLNDVCYGSSGKLLNGYEARLLDETGQPSPLGAEGNLWIKGNSSASGYWERPEETTRTFVDGWVRTGDLYRCDAEDHWVHMGRSDDCFKSSGQWVSPIEVEGVLLKHDKVARVAVVEHFDDRQLACPCAFVVSHAAVSDSTALEHDLRELASTALPRFKQPRKYVFISELPYTATGKIQRFKLRQELRTKERTANI